MSRQFGATPPRAYPGPVCCTLSTTAIATFLYVLIIGVERFCIESWGTLILSPLIYTRLLPAPLDTVLRKLLITEPTASFLLQVAPVALLVLALAAAAVALRRNSLSLALVSSALVASVFGVYHFLQPMGMSLILF